MIKMSGLVCDNCSVIIKYTRDITEEDRKLDFHLCEKCNPHPIEIISPEDLSEYPTEPQVPVRKRGSRRKKGE